VLGAGDVLLTDSRLPVQWRAPSAGLSTGRLLHVTYNQEWYRSPALSCHQQTAGFNALSPQLRSLFARVDQGAATAAARDGLEDLFVDVDALESNYEFDAFDYDESSFFADMGLTAAQYMRKMRPVIQHQYTHSSDIIEQREGEDGHGPPLEEPERLQ
jgi:hypothetical protein